MRKTLGIVVLTAAIAMTVSPGQARVRYYNYRHTYAAPTTPIVSIKYANLATLIDLGKENPSDDADLSGGPTDRALQDAGVGTKPLDGTQADTRPFAGSPVAGYPLKGSPADGEIGGVSFAAKSYKGIPYRLKVVDASGMPVLWSACQLHGPLPACGQNTNDITQVHCTAGDPASGARLSGFKSGQIDVWIIANDSAATSGTECDGVATQGAVTLTTRTS